MGIDRFGSKVARAFAIAALAGAAAPAAADHHVASPQEAAEMDDVATTPFVRPDVRAFLDRLKASPRPALTRELLAMIRKLPPGMMKSTDDLPVGELGEIRDVTMPGPGGEMQLRLYDPRREGERGPGPVVVFYHGGAFVVGSIETHAGLSAEMARALDLPVVSVEYRLAPEHPWPAAPDDAEAAARWIAENGSAFGRSFTSLVLSGDSAGGNLTLVTSLALRERPAVLGVVMQLPIYPAADRTKTYASGEMFREGYGLGGGSLPQEDLYQADPQSWRASPLVADLRGLPPTVLVTASLDPLRDQGRAFAAKLVESGVETAYYEAHGNIHGFAGYRKAIPSAQDDTAHFMALAATMLEELGARESN